ncbi:hypothetical protein ACUM5W_007027, partial [Pseudomonas aeruginosa]
MSTTYTISDLARELDITTRAILRESEINQKGKAR